MRDTKEHAAQPEIDFALQQAMIPERMKDPDMLDLAKLSGRGIVSQLGMIRFTSDENGKFDAQLVDKTTYRVYAVSYESSPHKVTSAEPVTIVPDELGDRTHIKLICLTKGIWYPRR